MKATILVALFGVADCFTIPPLTHHHNNHKRNNIPLKAFMQSDNVPYMFQNGFTSNMISEAVQALPVEATSSVTPPAPPPTTEISGLSASTNTIVFIIGLIPFLWATYEFWSRIAVGASFGTGSDSIQIRPQSEEMKQFTTIGVEGDLKKSRGQQVLGDDALIVAYILFAIAIGSVGIAVYSVISSPMDL